MPRPKKADLPLATRIERLEESDLPVLQDYLLYKYLGGEHGFNPDNPQYGAHRKYLNYHDEGQPSKFQSYDKFNKRAKVLIALALEIDKYQLTSEVLDQLQATP